MRKILLVCLLSGLVVIGCKLASGKASEDWKEYDLGSPEKFSMPESLLEISGITFVRNNPDTIYAIQDEDGKLFHFAWKGRGRNEHTKFGKTGDYEDLTIVRGQVYILKSNGTIYSFPLADAKYVELDNVAESKDLLPKGEYEGMYGDDKEGRIYILCKNCKGSKQTETVLGYVLQVPDTTSQGQLVSAGTFEIDVESIKPFSGKVKNGFRPSGLARNPVTNDWCIISGVNKLIVQTDQNWKVKAAYHLNGNTFNQPEGITFDNKGTMYISNEGDDISDGNILRFPRRK